MARAGGGRGAQPPWPSPPLLRLRLTLQEPLHQPVQRQPPLSDRPDEHHEAHGALLPVSTPPSLPTRGTAQPPLALTSPPPPPPHPSGSSTTTSSAARFRRSSPTSRPPSATSAGPTPGCAPFRTRRWTPSACRAAGQAAKSFLAARRVGALHRLRPHHRYRLRPSSVALPEACWRWLSSATSPGDGSKFLVGRPNATPSMPGEMMPLEPEVITRSA